MGVSPKILSSSRAWVPDFHANVFFPGGWKNSQPPLQQGVQLSTAAVATAAAAAAAAKSLQSCPTLCDPIDGRPPGSPVPGILQAKTLEWVAISFSSAWKWKVKGKLLSRVWLLATPWTAAHQAPPSMGFSRQEYWSGVPLPFPQLSTNCLLRWSQGLPWQSVVIKTLSSLAGGVGSIPGQGAKIPHATGYGQKNKK